MSNKPSAKIEISGALRNSKLLRQPPTQLARIIAAVLEAYEIAGSADLFIEAVNRAGIRVIPLPDRRLYGGPPFENVVVFRRDSQKNSLEKRIARGKNDG
jgi:hypothetical protein